MIIIVATLSRHSVSRTLWDLDRDGLVALALLQDFCIEARLQDEVSWMNDLIISEY